MLSSKFIQLLRFETAADQQQWQRISADLCKGSASEVRLKYVSYLKSMMVFLQAIESTIYPLLAPSFPAINTRKKAHAIAGDLIRLDSSISDGNSITIDLAGRDHIPFLAGMAYAAETCMQSSNELSRCLRSILGGEVPSGYLNIYGANAETMWKVFMDKLLLYADGLDDSDKQEIIKGAQYCFSLSREILEPAPVLVKVNRA